MSLSTARDVRPSDIIVLEADYRSIGMQEVVFLDQRAQRAPRRARILRRRGDRYAGGKLNEGALTLTTSKMILYANGCFARMVKCPLQKVIGTSFRRFLSAADRTILRPLIKKPGAAGQRQNREVRP